MDNALKNTRFLNFSRKTDAVYNDCKVNSPNLSPEIGLKFKNQQQPPEENMGVEQRVLWWFCQRGIRRGEPTSLLENYKEVQRKKIA